MNVAIVGTGYVGLVAGTCFAEMGNDVVCVDIDEQKVEALSRGRVPIYEPDLGACLVRNLRERRLRFTTELDDAIVHGDIIFLALPTPPGEDGEADVSRVLSVAGEIAEALSGDYCIVVTKSTVPVGTTDAVRRLMEGHGLVAGKDFDVVSNPEFLREGAAVGDFMKPERVILGTSSERAAARMRQLYEPFVRQGNPILVMDERSAELTKYAANAFLAMRISFMNEMSTLCDRVGADIDRVRIGIGSDSRIGKQFLYAGIGFGGSCFPKDVRALQHTAAAHDCEFRILEAVQTINESQRALLAERVSEYFGGRLDGLVVAVWGLAFKPNTDDVREAPSHVVIRLLLSAGAEVTAYDPQAIETSRAVFGDRVNFASGAYDALHRADALVICTEWPEFRRPNFSRIRELLRQPVIFDGRNLYNARRMADAGFDYFSIGRPRYAPRTD